MANDYFQDITPPDDSAPRRPAPAKPVPPPTPVHMEEEPETRDVPIRVDGTSQPPKGIRSIAPPRAVRPRMGDVRESPPMPGIMGGPTAPHARKRWWLWAAAALGVVVVLALVLLAFRSTTVTVTPRSHTIVLTDATPFTAYPSTNAASGTLAYTVQTADLEDSVVVPATGTTTSEPSKASGSITVYNSYSTSPVKLIKNTRFETPDGLVFRTPAEISVPGMKGSTPGSVSVTVVADQNGDQYNVGPISRFTVPGLKSNAAMYAGVYAKSTTAMSGGSSGVSGPGVAPSDLSAAVTKLQDSLKTKALDTVKAQAGEGMTILPELVQITYTTQPNTAEAGGGARVHESAHVEAPVFVTSELGQTVGSAVSADADNSAVNIIPGEGFAAHVPGSSPDLAAGPLQFTLTGQANLIWVVDSKALAEALAGRDQGAFQTAISGFTGIQEAHAKIEPFWKSTFPSDPNSIKIVVTDPKPAQ